MNPEPLPEDFDPLADYPQEPCGGRCGDPNCDLDTWGRRLTTPTGIEAVVCRDVAERQAKGLAKYGTTVADNPLDLRQWLQHAYEECLDMAVYLRRAMAEIDRNEPDGR